MADTEKLQKVLASRGLGSRREMERWIEAGDVIVNGEVATIGQRVGETDDISVRGQNVNRAPNAPTRMLLANKREGVIVTRKDPEGRRSIFEDLPSRSQGRWLTVGRLDLNTSGLILLTDNGELANRLMHPSSGLDREYAVRIDGKLSEEEREQLLRGVTVEDRVERFSDLQYYNGSGTNHWYHVVLMEGRNREIRRLFAHFGYRVSRLKRVRFGPVVLPSWLKRGRWTELDPTDIQALQSLVGLTPETYKPPRATVRKQTKPTRSVLIPYPGLSVPAKNAHRTADR